MTLNESFCKDAYALPQVRCEEWQGWVMVTLNPDAPPVAEQLSGVQDLIGDFGMEHDAQTFCETHRGDTN